MLEDKSALVERRDETQDASGFAILQVETFQKRSSAAVCCLVYLERNGSGGCARNIEGTALKSGVGSSLSSNLRRF